jgi:hypothetical protein
MKLTRAVACAATLAFAASLFTATSAFADTEGDFSYSVDSGAASVNGYSGVSTDMVIPATLGGYPVTAIAIRAFQDKSLSSVTIPEGITSIGALAFVRTNLSSVTLPASLTIIESGAFQENRINSVTIPANVTEIQDNAFAGQVPQIQSVLFLGNAPTMTAAVFQGTNANFRVSCTLGTTGFGFGETWLGYTISQFPYVRSTSGVTAGVTAGVRSAGLTAAAFDSGAFSHAEQAIGTDVTLSVDDLTGANAGWNVTVSSSELTWSAATDGPTAGSDLPAGALAVTTVGSITTVSGDAWAGDTAIGALGSPVKVLSTSGGSGSYTAALTLTLTIPGQASVGTYAGTLTTTISAAP